MISNNEIEEQKQNSACLLGQFIHLEWLKCEWISMCLKMYIHEWIRNGSFHTVFGFSSSVSVSFVDFQEHFKAGFTCMRIISHFLLRFKCHFIIINYVICVQYLWSCHRSKMNVNGVLLMPLSYYWYIETLQNDLFWMTDLPLFCFGSTFTSPSDVYLEAINSFIKLEIILKRYNDKLISSTRFCFHGDGVHI